MKTDIAILLFIIFMASGFVGLGGNKLITYVSPFSPGNNVSVTPTITQPPLGSTPTPTGAASPTPTSTPSFTPTPTP